MNACGLLVIDVFLKCGVEGLAMIVCDTVNYHGGNGGHVILITGLEGFEGLRQLAGVIKATNGHVQAGILV